MLPHKPPTTSEHSLRCGPSCLLPSKCPCHSLVMVPANPPLPTIPFPPCTPSCLKMAHHSPPKHIISLLHYPPLSQHRTHLHFLLNHLHLLLHHTRLLPRQRTLSRLRSSQNGATRLHQPHSHRPLPLRLHRHPPVHLLPSTHVSLASAWFTSHPPYFVHRPVLAVSELAWLVTRGPYPALLSSVLSTLLLLPAPLPYATCTLGCSPRLFCMMTRPTVES